MSRQHSVLTTCTCSVDQVTMMLTYGGCQTLLPRPPSWKDTLERWRVLPGVHLIWERCVVVLEVNSYIFWTQNSSFKLIKGNELSHVMKLDKWKFEHIFSPMLNYLTCFLLLFLLKEQTFQTFSFSKSIIMVVINNFPCKLQVNNELLSECFTCQHTLNVPVVPTTVNVIAYLVIVM